MEYLYVCHFSNGHIKVGRSIDPRARIAAHADRVACMGVELVEHHVVECIARSAPAETELIVRCTDNAARRMKSEWFDGLDYSQVTSWATEIALKEPKEVPQTGIQKALDLFHGSPSRLANAIGGSVIRQHIEHWLKTGRVPADKAPDVMLATGISVDLLCPDTNWDAVRNGAPDLTPTPETARVA